MSNWTIIRSNWDGAWANEMPEKAKNGPVVHLIVDTEVGPNVLAATVLEELRSKCAELREMNDVGMLMIWSAKDKHFIAGADVSEIAGLTDPVEAAKQAAVGQDIFQEFAELPFPTLALINGTCLGGGFEFVLACDYRIAVDSPNTKIGLPEVQLGIIPGFGGCQRLPRLIGVVKSLGLILGSKRLPAKSAYRQGVVDEVIPPEAYHQTALHVAKRIIADRGARLLARRAKLQKGWLNKILNGTNFGRNFAAKKARKQVMAQTKGHYPAPFKAIDAIIQGFPLDMKSAL